MKKISNTFLALVATCLAIPTQAQVHKPAPDDTSVNQMEKLKRGLVVIKDYGTNKYFASWRYLGTDNVHTGFNLLKNGNLYQKDIYSTTSLSVSSKENDKWQVVTVQDGVAVDTTEAVTPWENYYKTIKTNRPASVGSVFYTPNDCSAGDVDGDGEYELIVKWEPSNSKDNASSGKTEKVFLDCYKLDGTQLWRIDLGYNIRAGAHYTQFLVYDFDKDGKAELVCKTAPGSIDGKGRYVSEAADEAEIKSTDNAKDYRDNGSVSKGTGHVLSGPEYLTVFNGETGAAIHTVYYNPNRAGGINSIGTNPDKSFWNDNYGNRADRFLACVAYLDGKDKKPSAVMCRGYYTRAYLWAVDFDGKKLSTKWLHASTSKSNVDLYDGNFNKTSRSYSSNTSGKGNLYTVFGNGNHNISVADVDGDGCDEILYGSSAINNDGNLLYATGLGHGDAMHVGDLMPDRLGLEVFSVHEDAINPYGFDIHDAATGEILRSGTSDRDTGRGIAADFDGDHRGYEYTWATQTSSRNVVDGNIYDTNPGMCFRMYWDGDLYDDMVDGTSIRKWTKGSTSEMTIARSAVGSFGHSASCNGTKATPNLCADLFGDWREEIIYWDSSDSCTLNVFSTTKSTDYRVPCLMHDHTYRMGIAWQNVAYNQPAHLGYYLPDYVDSFKGVLPSTGIYDTEIATGTPVKTEYYTLSGIKVPGIKYAAGVYIVKEVYADGTSSSRKVIVR